MQLFDSMHYVLLQMSNLVRIKSHVVVEKVLLSTQFISNLKLMMDDWKYFLFYLSPLHSSMNIYISLLKHLRLGGSKFHFQHFWVENTFLVLFLALGSLPTEQWHFRETQFDIRIGLQINLKLQNCISQM